MCGIFGFVLNKESKMSEDGIRGMLPLICRLSERRGSEASGIAIGLEGAISYFKKPMRPTQLVKETDFRKFIDSKLGLAASGESRMVEKPFAVIGNSRLVTNGTQAVAQNNQPVGAGRVVGVHNGIITNSDRILEKYPNVRNAVVDSSDSDTSVLMGLINEKYAESGDIKSALAETYSDIEGSASIAFMCENAPFIALATNTGSLFYSNDPSARMFVFGSEKFIVERFLAGSKIASGRDFVPVVQIKPHTAAIVDIHSGAPDIYDMRGYQSGKKMVISGKRSGLYKIFDESESKVELKRCTRCILPESYPFIAFDEEGVCNYCRRYKKQEYLGKAALEEVLSKHRSKDGKPDCIYGLSGGRDSSYGLHVLVKEFGMHPIAYTYDWALVTDLSRRNQARITGKLGVEHLIRAADIHAKRRHIRKNIYAWLKRPKLGMVTIFMAGDKMFYYYGRQLRKETGIDFTVFASGQQVEQMEFKVGYCGINKQLVNNTRLYDYGASAKMRLALWYGKEFMLNPSYLNESLPDNIFAFYSSFLNKDDYLYLYNYLPWDEKLIEKTVIEQYGWESDVKYGGNQWRMGDGQTAFINYIYYTIGGFSEFDNFRSNQVREGWIKREEALNLAEKDNRPRIDMLLDFSQLIGFNLEDVLLRINSIPKTYIK